MVAADAGVMQIQLGEGTVIRCAEAVLKGTTPRAARSENWLRRKSSAKSVVEEPGGKDLFGDTATSKWAFRTSGAMLLR